MNHPPTLRKRKEGRTIAVVGDVYRILATGEETIYRSEDEWSGQKSLF